MSAGSVLPPDIRSGPVVELAGPDRDALDRLIAADPYANAVLASRLAPHDSLHPVRLGGRLFGVPGASGLRAAVFHGGNLLPVGGAEPDWTALARHLADRPRTCSSIVGPAGAVHAMWRVLYPAWGPARAIRYAQPLLVADHVPAGPVDARLRAIEPDEIGAYLPAAIAMFTEELGVAPAATSGTAAYYRRVEWLISTGRAFGIIDGDGRVVFKADLGAITTRTCQVQGVWVRPDLRGSGIATAALAAVFEHALRLAPTVSLYVNDYNEPARRLYARLGMREVGTFASIML